MNPTRSQPDEYRVMLRAVHNHVLSAQSGEDITAAVRELCEAVKSLRDAEAGDVLDAITVVVVKYNALPATLRKPPEAEEGKP